MSHTTHFVYTHDGTIVETQPPMRTYIATYQYTENGRRFICAHNARQLTVYARNYLHAVQQTKHFLRSHYEWAHLTNVTRIATP